MRGGVSGAMRFVRSKPEIALAAGLAALTAWRLFALQASPLTLMFDEAQYWTWSCEPAFGYYSKPPMIAWIIAAATGLCGDGEACVRAASPILHLAGAGAVFLLARRLFDRRAGLAAAALYATLPGVAFSSTVISTDVPLLLFWALALFFLHRALCGDRRADWLAFGLAFGGGLLAKYTMVLLLPCAALFLVLAPRRPGRPAWRNPRLFAALAVALAVVSPNLAWNAAHGFATLAHVGDNANLGGPLLHPDKLAVFLGAQFGVFGPIAFAALLWLAARWRRTAAESPNALFLLCFSVPVIGLMAAQGLLSRAHANWAAVAYVAATALVAWRLFAHAGPGAARRRRLFAAALALHVAAMPAIHHYDAIVGDRVAAFDPLYRMRGWDALGAQLSVMLAENPGAALLADEREHMAQFIYYVRPHPFDAVKWNPRGGARDHYDLTADAAGAAGRPMLLVTRRPDAGHVAPRFSRSRHLGAIEAAPHAGLALRYDVYRLDGFLGYGARP